MRIDYGISEVAPYINWAYFYHAWGIASSPHNEKQQLRSEAEAALQRCEGHYQTHALFNLYEANSDGDDILIGQHRLPFLRQQKQGSECLCLADYIRPLSMGLPDRIGVFATTVDIGLETDFEVDPYAKMMMQLLADRLAEATAEKMHERVRRTDWGYAPDEQLTIEEQHAERFVGIRPAVGYPSLPDTSFNFVIDELLQLRQIGIRLTESGAMKPHASVSGLMIAHPEARYFAVGKIGEDQLGDYARRRGIPVSVMRRFLSSNL
ncbi:MAG: 5-methyltetrahydrofolate--homocysteine methyltransferase [Prevotella sp.]|nr:5-methyltetrahydrofolate--homocysteine methyltransferase [Prevotella sp.]